MLCLTLQIIKFISGIYNVSLANNKFIIGKTNIIKCFQPKYFCKRAKNVNTFEKKTKYIFSVLSSHEFHVLDILHKMNITQSIVLEDPTFVTSKPQQFPEFGSLEIWKNINFGQIIGGFLSARRNKTKIWTSPLVFMKLKRVWKYFNILEQLQESSSSKNFVSKSFFIR